MASTEAERQYPSFASRAKTVFKAWLKEPAQISSLVPSSHALTEEIADRDCVRRARLVVDLGPGTGETTQALLQHMNASARLIAIEKSEHLMEPLRKISDPRVMVIHGDARFLRLYLDQAGLGAADVIVSGIPFSTVPAQVAEQVIEEIDRALPHGGTFIAYQLSNKVEELATPLFGQPQVEYVWLNFPPLRVFSWVKQASRVPVASK
ncbi:MAG TPA: SAM-dependent methyltransferase [Planctomycetaceae bacterium]|nr:SAM-dependent methyltransferase [Planctomycetaceae bacterium]